jgi:hypothetical protein
VQYFFCSTHNNYCYNIGHDSSLIGRHNSHSPDKNVLCYGTSVRTVAFNATVPAPHKLREIRRKQCTQRPVLISHISLAKRPESLDVLRVHSIVILIDEMRGMINGTVVVNASAELRYSRVRCPLIGVYSGSRQDMTLDEGQERCCIASSYDSHKTASCNSLHSAEHPAAWSVTSTVIFSMEKICLVDFDFNRTSSGRVKAADLDRMRLHPRYAYFTAEISPVYHGAIAQDLDFSLDDCERDV